MSVLLLVGVTLDPAHGYVLTLAAGGVLTELLQDRVNLSFPRPMMMLSALRSRPTRCSQVTAARLPPIWMPLCRPSWRCRITSKLRNLSK